MDPAQNNPPNGGQASDKPLAPTNMPPVPAPSDDPTLTPEQTDAILEENPSPPDFTESSISPIIVTPPSPSRPRAKIVGTILAVLILVIGIPAGILLVGQSQETRERAEDEETTDQGGGGGESDISGPSQEEIDAADEDPDLYEEWVAEGGNGSPGDFQEHLEAIGKQHADNPERYGFSPQKEEDVQGAADRDPDLYDRWVKEGGSGKVADFEKHVSAIGKRSADNPELYGYTLDKEIEIVDRDQTLYQRWLAEGGARGDREAFKKHLDAIGKQFPSNPERYGFKPEPIAAAGKEEDDGGPSFTAQCLNIKVYDTNWNQLSAIQLPGLKKGDPVRFAVVGGISHGTIDKARFRINDGTWQETAVKNPNNEYYVSYTIPQVTIQIVPPPPLTTKVEAQIHLKETNQWF